MRAECVGIAARWHRLCWLVSGQELTGVGAKRCIPYSGPAATSEVTREAQEGGVTWGGGFLSAFGGGATRTVASRRSATAWTRSSTGKGPNRCEQKVASEEK
jgi:hypothetical protein